MTKQFSLVLVLGICLAMVSVTLGFEKRIVGGKQAVPKYVRHLAYIFVRKNGGSSFSCTGTIVGRRWVLSAAHCFVPASTSKSTELHEATVFVGSSSAYPFLSQAPLAVSRILVHQGWKGDELDLRHDVALLELEQPLPQKDFHPVLLAEKPSAGTRVIAVGYGATSESGPHSSFAKQATLISQKFETCSQREIVAFRKFLREDFQTCATSLGFPHKGLTDTCYGDSGGPLFRFGNGHRALQFGITSFANGACGEAGATPWYVRISAYEKDIRTVMRTGLANAGSFRKLQRK